MSSSVSHLRPPASMHHFNSNFIEIKIVLIVLLINYSFISLSCPASASAGSASPTPPSSPCSSSHCNGWRINWLKLDYFPILLSSVLACSLPRVVQNKASEKDVTLDAVSVVVEVVDEENEVIRRQQHHRRRRRRRRSNLPLVIQMQMKQSMSSNM